MVLKKKYKLLIIILIILALGGLFYTFFIQIRHVKAGEIGVTASLGSAVDNDKDFDIQTVKGYVVFIPLYTDFVTYPTTIQIISYDSIAVLSKDGAHFYIKPQISYQLDGTKAVQYYKSVRSPLHETNKTYLKEIITVSYASSANTFTADSLAVNKNLFDSSAEVILKRKMDEIGLVLKSSVSNLEYPETIKSAMAMRVKINQDAIIAQSKQREADAIRREDSLRYSALTPLAIQKMFIDKWDGKMSSTGEISRIYDSISKNK